MLFILISSLLLFVGDSCNNPDRQWIKVWSARSCDELGWKDYRYDNDFFDEFHIGVSCTCSSPVGSTCYEEPMTYAAATKICTDQGAMLCDPLWLELGEGFNSGCAGEGTGRKYWTVSRCGQYSYFAHSQDAEGKMTEAECLVINDLGGDEPQLAHGGKCCAHFFNEASSNRDAPSESELEGYCNASSGGSKKDCKNSIAPAFGLCKKRKKGSCKLKVAFKGNCAALSRRDCKKASIAGACDMARGKQCSELQ